MSERSHSSRLFDLWRRRRDDTESEPADVGTAFGMELSLMPEDDMAAARAGTKAASAGWIRRLVRWRGS